MTVTLRQICRLPVITGALLLVSIPAFAQDSGLTINEAPPIAGTTRPEAVSMAPDAPVESPFVLKRPADSYADTLAEETLPAEPETPPPADSNQPEPNTIVLQGLNKVTGHISRLEAPIGTVMRFGNLEIIGRRCWKSPPDEQPENAGLLEIWELKPGESHERIFLGWAFSSSPGLSGLQHPVYDVTVLECLALDDAEKGSAEEKADDKDKEDAKDSKKSK